jgi:hypothetical protein
MKTRFFFDGIRVLAAAATVMVLVACGDEGGGAGGTGGTGGTGSAGSTTGSTTTGAGTTSSGASSGSGSSTTPGLIDDMEDNDDAILTAESRQGYWYTFNDQTPTGMQTPPTTGFTMSLLPTPRGDSKYAARTNGSGFTVWGAGMGLNLNGQGTTKSSYDASGYTGLTFWAMAPAGSTTSLRVSVPDVDTSPEGGVCAGAKCNDHFGTSIELSTSWKQYPLKFSDLKQEGFGQPFPGIKASALYAISFSVTTNTTFDVYIDDIAFTK